MLYRIHWVSHITPHCFILESKPRESYPRYSSPQRVRDFEQRENNNNEFYSGKRDREYTPERSYPQEEPRREMRGDGQGRERSSSYDRGRMYSPYVSEKRDEGRPYPENDNDYRKSVGDAEVSDLNQPYHCFERPSYLKRFKEF